MNNPPQKTPHPEAAAREHSDRPINLTTDPPAALAVRVDWIWTVSVERVLEGPPDLLSCAS